MICSVSMNATTSFFQRGLLTLSKTRLPLNLTATLFQNHARSYSSDLQSRLLLFRLRNQGHTKTWSEFNEFMRSTGSSFSGTEEIIARDKTGHVYKSFPNFVVTTEKYIRLNEVSASSENSNFRMIHAIRKRDKKSIREMVANGFDINKPNHNGRPPLFYAVETGSLSLVDFMITLGANPRQYENSAWNYNFTAYHHGIRLRFYEITRRFIETHGVAVDQPVAFSDYGWPPEAIDFACPPDGKFVKVLTPFKHAETEKNIDFITK